MIDDYLPGHVNPFIIFIAGRSSKCTFYGAFLHGEKNACGRDAEKVMSALLQMEKEDKNEFAGLTLGPKYSIKSGEKEMEMKWFLAVAFMSR